MKYWKKLTHKEQDKIITAALKKNINYEDLIPLGIPVSKLDPDVFYEQASFLNEAPLLRTYIHNPNHIGCHTHGESEPFFSGTQQLEKDVIELLSVDVFKAEEHSCDGYIAAGGTEANIQAAWIYRNYFIEERKARIDEIALLSSTDTHYSVAKAADLLNLRSFSVAVFDRSRIDDPDVYAKYLKKNAVEYKIHIDAAFGGFVFPISQPDSTINFSNPEVSSITLDAHKMLQAPYGTGIFLVRKGYMQFAVTKNAKYVNGMDTTLSGSRSGANAVAVWMILFNYGPHGWLEKISKLLYRTTWLATQLAKMGVGYYRHHHLNIIAIDAEHITHALAARYGLVPDTHTEQPRWYKIVVMEHVEIDYLEKFLADLK